jgi:hypothetical protein
MGLFKNFMKSMQKISRPVFSFDDNQLIFKIDSDDFYRYSLESFETNTRHDSYIYEAYTLKTKNIFLEYINTDSNVDWTGAAESLFFSLMKEKLNIKKIEVLETYSFNHYEFNSYKVEDDYILNFIHIDEIDKDIFIIDLNGELYSNLLVSLKKDYTYNYENYMLLNRDIDFSLVKENAFYNYFTHVD